MPLQRPYSERKLAQLSVVEGLAFRSTGPTAAYPDRCAATNAAAQSGSGKQWSSDMATRGARAARIPTTRAAFELVIVPASTMRTLVKPLTASAGMAIMCSGLALLSQIDAHSSELDIVWRLLVIGFGVALFQSPNNSALLGSAPPDRRGIASGVLATCRVVGQSLSIALAGAVFAGAGGSQAGRGLLHANPNQTAQLRDQLTSAFRTTFLTCAAVAAIGVVTSLIRGPEDKPGRKPRAELRSRTGAEVS